MKWCRIKARWTGTWLGKTSEIELPSYGSKKLVRIRFEFKARAVKRVYTRNYIWTVSTIYADAFKYLWVFWYWGIRIFRVNSAISCNPWTSKRTAGFVGWRFKLSDTYSKENERYRYIENTNGVNFMIWHKLNRNRGYRTFPTDLKNICGKSYMVSVRLL